MENIIKIQNLNVEVSGKCILRDINLSFEIWKNYLLLWRNWSWKSSLAQFLMWNPKYKCISWKVYLWNKDLLEIDSYDRARNGIFLSFQNVPEIPWINLGDYLRIIYNNHIKEKWIRPLTPFVFRRFLKKYLDELEIDESFLKRDLNVWFSWWEKRKMELLQARLIEPQFIILDEIDSWLDVVAFEKVSKYLNNINSKDNSLIIITHHLEIVDYLDIDFVYILKDGKVFKKWDKSLINEVKERWFN